MGLRGGDREGRREGCEFERMTECGRKREREIDKEGEAKKAGRMREKKSKQEIPQ